MSKPIKVLDMDLSQMMFSNLEDSPFVKSQKTAHIYYGKEGNLLTIQTPEILTESYGIPGESQYYNTIQSRSFYKLPFCFDRKQYENEVDYSLIKLFHDKLLEIDNYCNTDEFRTKLFANNANKYEYQPIVRFPSEDDVNNQYYRPPYIKVKLVLDQISSKPYFSVFNNLDGKRESIEVKNLRSY